MVVVVNGITGSCNSNNCSFDYSAEQTPNLTSITPSSGPGGPSGIGTVITLGGSGFSTVNEENVVTIGGSKCVIQTSAADTITCRAGNWSSRAERGILSYNSDREVRMRSNS